MALETISGTAPSHWACYFLNGDSDGMEAEDIAAADLFAAWLGGNIVSCEDAGFLWYHDARQFCPLGSDCQTYTALIDRPIFAELAIGQGFDWVNPDARPGFNSFFEKCWKISPRRYQTESGMTCRVGTIKAPVFHVEKVKP